MRIALLLLALSACAVDARIGTARPTRLAAEPTRPAAEPARLPASSPKKNRYQPEVQPITIPFELVGLSLDDATDRLKAVGHRGSIAYQHGKCQQPAEPDRVCGSQPALGKAIDPGTHILLYLAPRGVSFD